MEEIFVIMHANKIWVNIFFTNHKVACNYIKFNIRPCVRVDENTFKNPVTQAKYKIEKLEPYQK